MIELRLELLDPTGNVIFGTAWAPASEVMTLTLPDGSGRVIIHLRREEVGFGEDAPQGG